MELFKTILFSTSLYLYGYGVLFDLMLVYFFLSAVNKTKTNITYQLTFDSIFINLIKMFIQLFIYNFNILVAKVNKTTPGWFLIKSYQYVDNKLVKFKQSVFTKVFGMLVKRAMTGMFSVLLDDQVFKVPKLNRTSEYRLSTNAEVSDFLDRLLDKKNKTD